MPRDDESLTGTCEKDRSGSWERWVSRSPRWPGIWGSTTARCDRMAPTKNSIDLAKHLPDSELVIYQGAGHGGIFQLRHGIVTKVLDLLAEWPRSPMQAHPTPATDRT